MSIKLLLHPIVRVYTCKCAMNIVEKYEHGLVAGIAEICTCKQGEFFQQESHYLFFLKQNVTSYRSHSGFIYMQGTHECMI